MLVYCEIAVCTERPRPMRPSSISFTRFEFSLHLPLLRVPLPFVVSQSRVMRSGSSCDTRSRAGTRALVSMQLPFSCHLWEIRCACGISSLVTTSLFNAVKRADRGSLLRRLVTQVHVLWYFVRVYYDTIVATGAAGAGLADVRFNY